MKEWTEGNRVIAWTLWKSTTQWKVAGEMALLFHVHKSHCALAPVMPEQWVTRFMCADITKEQVNPTENK